MFFISFLAKRISFQGNKSVSRLVLYLAIISIAFGIAVMEIAIAVVNGFEEEIQTKLIGFASPIQLGAYLPEANSEARPLQNNAEYAQKLLNNPYVKKISPFIHLPALLKSKASIEGIIIKGVDSTWNKEFFQEYLKEGSLPNLSHKNPYELLISRKIANALQLKVGDKSKVYFLGENTRARLVQVSGIYETGLAEFDQNIVIASIVLNQQMLKWDSTEIEGYDVFLNTHQNLPEIAQEWDKDLPMEVRARPIQQLFPEIFDWIKLQHQNVGFILVLLLTISIINMSAALIVRIVERTYMIGLLKAMGMKPLKIRLIFIYNAFFIILSGVFLGNFLGLGLLKLQETFQFITFDPESYFVYTVPIQWAWWDFFLLNLIVVIICTLSMFLPTWVIQQIKPVKALKF
ncbi:MAG: permease [Bacteroidia bacterium]|nr:MAG: permease [Bacteroidia bacterium]